MTEVFIFAAIYVATLVYFEVKIYRARKGHTLELIRLNKEADLLVEKNKDIQFDLGVARINAEFWHNEARKGGVGR